MCSSDLEIKIVVATSLIDTQVLARTKAVGADSLWYKAVSYTHRDVYKRQAI